MEFTKAKTKELKHSLILYARAIPPTLLSIGVFFILYQLGFHMGGDKIKYLLAAPTFLAMFMYTEKARGAVNSASIACEKAMRLVWKYKQVQKADLKEEEKKAQLEKITGEFVENYYNRITVKSHVQLAGAAAVILIFLMIINYDSWMTGVPSVFIVTYQMAVWRYFAWADDNPIRSRVYRDDIPEELKKAVVEANKD